jgi:hypothetical protein
MEAATVAGRAAAPAHAPRPAPKRVPRDRPQPGRKPRSRPKPARGKSASRPARKASGEPATKPRRAPATRPRTAPARRPRTRPAAPGRRGRTGSHLIPIAVGTATAVRQFPDSPLIVRMTRGRLWIGVLGALLAGIVALNVFTLSLTAEAGHIDQNIVALEKENSLLRSRDAQRSGAARVRHDAGAIGLQMAAVDEVSSIEPSRRDVAVAVQRLAAAGTGY